METVPVDLSELGAVVKNNVWKTVYDALIIKLNAIDASTLV